MPWTTLATCAPFLDGFGFRAALEADGRSFRIVSTDYTGPVNTRETSTGAPLGAWQTHLDRQETSIRFTCRCDDVRYNGHHGDAGIAELIASFAEAYATRPEEFDRDPEEIEQAPANREWWSRWGDHLTGCDDNGEPYAWAGV